MLILMFLISTTQYDWAITAFKDAHSTLAQSSIDLLEAGKKIEATTYADDLWELQNKMNERHMLTFERRGSRLLVLGGGSCIWSDGMRRLRLRWVWLVMKTRISMVVQKRIFQRYCLKSLAFPCLLSV